MGIRLLHSRGGYLWCAFILLAGLSPVAQSAPKYVQVTNDKVFQKSSEYWFKELNRSFSNGQLTTTSTLNTAGKTMSLPAVVKPAASAGKAVLRFAKSTTPLLLGLELLPYVLDAIPDLDSARDDGWYKEPDGSNSQEYFGVYNDGYYCNHTTEGSAKGSTREIACGPYGYSNVIETGGKYYCATAGGSNRCQVVLSGTCSGTQVWDDATQACTAGAEPDPFTDQEWEDAIELTPLPPLTDAEATSILEKNPDGIPIETPEHTTLPQEVPISDAHQEPGADPATGQWWQDILKLFPADYPTVKVEPKIVPVSGPEGIDEPTPYTGPETEQDLDTGDPTPVSIVNQGDTTIDVQICEPGDTRLMCTELGTPPEEEVPSDVFDLTWDHAPVVFSEGACPAGPSAMTPWGDVTIDMYWPCEFAKAIKPITLVCAMFAALYIFITGLRTD